MNESENYKRTGSLEPEYQRSFDFQKIVTLRSYCSQNDERKECQEL